jgi:serine protease Do
VPVLTNTALNHMVTEYWIHGGSMRNILRMAIVLCGFILFVPSLFAEAGDAKKPARPDVPFVEKSETIGVSRVMIKIPYGTKVAKVVGTTHSEDMEWTASTVKDTEQFKEVAERHLKNFGYNIIEEDLFQTSTSAKARFQVGGIVTKFFANYKYTGGGGCFGPSSSLGSCKIDLDAEFQLYDSVKDKVVFRMTKSGYYENTKDIDAIEKLIVMAYEDAFLRFMAEPDFVQTVSSKKDSSQAPADANAPLRVGYVENGAATVMPGSISKLFAAVVTIKAGTTHGSGVIISDDGYILTAAHVVSGLITVGVELEKGEKLEGKVVRVNRNNDSAIVKVSLKNAKAIGVNFENPPIGSEVYIIGTPLDKTLSYSVTKGIVSGYREKDGVKYIQTDSAVNPGNSGGPMLDGNGQVIGIVSSKIIGAAVDNIGFAIPVQVALKSLTIVK